MLTAANDQQAAAYESQIRMRRSTQALSGARNVLVMPDAGGRRVGSGGSSIQCLREVLRREGAHADGAEEALRELRILIVHAGGDSRRLPAYSPCGKIFVPLPDESTIFDRLAPTFLGLPQGVPGSGQVVIAAGDALLLFDPAEADFSQPGIAVLGATVEPEEAVRHGVLAANPDGSVRLFLQKPSFAELEKSGAIGGDGQCVLDIGVMSLDATSAAGILGVGETAGVQSAISSEGIDLYREICCALGTDTTFADYLASTRKSGSRIAEPVLAELYDRLRPIPLRLTALRECHFLHFGSTRQLISSGNELVTRDCGAPPPDRTLSIASEITPPGRLDATESWMEGCRVHAPLTLRGYNVIVGVDVNETLEMPEGACLDVSPGTGRDGERVWFIRYYGIDDSFKNSSYRGRPMADWAQASIWDADTPERERTLWNARIFPAEKEHPSYARWAWMLHLDQASAEQKAMFEAADRYSAAEIALRIDHTDFHERRMTIRRQR